MKLGACAGRNCPCNPDGETRAPLRPIENEVFGHLRMPLKGESTRFHFVLLDGYRGYAASLGLPAVVSAAAEDRTGDATPERIARLMQQLSGDPDLTVHELTARFVEDQDAGGMAALRAWAGLHLGDLGQPLSDNPSRVEQCLAIRAAQQASDAPLDDRLWPVGGRPDGPFKIDSYLVDAPVLSDAWTTAARALGAQPPQAGLKPPLTVDTAAFLVAEYLQFALAGECGPGFIARLARSPPGMAVLPLRILAQYRAAAVWFYEGRLDDACNDGLRAHIARIGEDASRWIEPLIEAAFINASSLALVDTLAQHGFAPGAPTLLHCRRVQQALSDLWFCSRLTAPGVEGGELSLPAEDSDGARSQLFGAAQLAMQVDATQDADVAKLLGFRTLELTAPLLDPRHEERDRACARASAMLTIVNKSAYTALERAAAQRRLTVSVAGHEVANSLDEIMTFASNAGWRDEALTPTQRLDVIKSMAEYQSAAIWVMRALARGTLDVLNDRLPVATRAPAGHELEFWRSYLLGRLKYALYARWWSVRPDRRKARPVRLILKYAFEAVDRVDGPVFRPRSEQDIVIDRDFTPGAIDDPVGLSQPLWPMDPDIRNLQDKLGEYGRLSLLLWGGVELARNAGQAAAKKLQVIGDLDEETVSVDARISAESGRNWRLRIEAKNPSFFVADPLEVPALRRIRDVLGETRCRFLQVSQQPGQTHYAFELDLHGEGAGL